MSDDAKLTGLVRSPSARESAVWAVWEAQPSPSCEERELGGLKNSQNGDLLFLSLSKPSQCLLWARPWQATGDPDVNHTRARLCRGRVDVQSAAGTAEGLWDPEGVFFSLPSSLFCGPLLTSFQTGSLRGQVGWLLTVPGLHGL